MKQLYNDLRHYGEVIADKSHETTEGNFIRFTTFKYEDNFYIITMFNGDVIIITEKKDIRELI